MLQHVLVLFKHKQAEHLEVLWKGAGQAAPDAVCVQL